MAVSGLPCLPPVLKEHALKLLNPLRDKGQRVPPSLQRHAYVCLCLRAWRYGSHGFRIFNKDLEFASFYLIEVLIKTFAAASCFAFFPLDCP